MWKKRPPSHVDGELGELRVMTVLTEHQWICQKIPKDYGDDLLIVPVFRNHLRRYFIFSQVKSVRIFKRVTIELADLARWVLADVLVVLFVYEQESEKLYYKFLTHLPEAWYVTFDRIMRDRESVTVKASEFGELSDFGHFSWECDLLVNSTRFKYLIAMRDHDVHQARVGPDDEAKAEWIARVYLAKFLVTAQETFESCGYPSNQTVNRQVILKDMVEFAVRSGGAEFIADLEGPKVFVGLFCAFKFAKGLYDDHLIQYVRGLTEALHALLDDSRVDTKEYWISLLDGQGT